MGSATEMRGSRAAAGSCGKFAAGNEARPPLREKATEVLHAVREMGSDAKKMAQERVAKLRGSASEYLQQGRTKAESLEKSFEDGIRQKPVRSILIAAGLGFVLGVFLRRR